MQRSMKALALAAAVSLVSVASVRAQAPADAPAATPPTTQPNDANYRTVSYGIGLQIGQSLKQLPFPIDFQQLLAGLEDGRSGAEPKYDEQTLMAAQMAVQGEIATKAEAEQTAAVTRNKEAGQKYLDENAKKDGVKTLPSGVQVETLTEGTGAAPAATDSVTVHYTGKLIDGTVFDSSRNPDGTGGEPVTFPLNQVIPGWTEGLQQMKVGGKARLVIPQDKAYGERGAPPVIPPGSTLVFEIELLDAKPAAQAPATPPPAR
jgi:FKBP-type peptidyl-prolyl cis-trans isomerase